MPRATGRRGSRVTSRASSRSKKGTANPVVVTPSDPLTAADTSPTHSVLNQGQQNESLLPSKHLEAARSFPSPSRRVLTRNAKSKTFKNAQDTFSEYSDASAFSSQQKTTIDTNGHPSKGRRRSKQQKCNELEKGEKQPTVCKTTSKKEKPPTLSPDAIDMVIPLFQSTQPIELQPAAALQTSSSRMLRVARPGSDMFQPVPYIAAAASDDPSGNAVVLLDAEDSSDVLMSHPINKQKLPVSNVKPKYVGPKTRSRKLSSFVASSPQRASSRALSDVSSNNGKLLKVLPDACPATPYKFLASHLRFIARLVYQNAAFLRAQHLLQLGVPLTQDCANRDPVAQLLPYLGTCRATQQSFILLVMGAPEREKGSMVRAAIRLLIKETHQNKDKSLHCPSVPQWALTPIIIPPFYHNEAACLRLITRALFQLLSPDVAGSLKDFILKTTINWASATDRIKKRTPTGDTQQDSLRLLRTDASGAPDSEKNSSKLPQDKGEPESACRGFEKLELKHLTFQQNVKLVRVLLQRLREQYIIPIITVESMEPLVFGGTQFRQALLYSLCNLIHASDVCFGFIGCSSLMNLSSFFEKRIQSRVGLCRIYFTSSATPQDLAASLSRVFTMGSDAQLETSSTSAASDSDRSNYLLPASCASLNAQLSNLISATHVQNLIELYASLDHRAFEFLVQHISLQLLVFLTRAKYFGRVPSALPSCNAASNKTVVLDQPSASQSSAQTPETRKRYRRAPLPRASAQQSADVSPGPLSANVDSSVAPSLATRSEKELDALTALLPPPTVLGTISFDWKLDHHDTLLPQLCLSELLILAAMAQLHRKHVVPKTLIDVSKEVRRIEKMSIVSGRWSSALMASYTEMVPQRIRIAFDRLLQFRVLEPSLVNTGSFLAARPDQQYAVKYPYYSRFLKIYPKLHLPTNVERYLQSM